MSIVVWSVDGKERKWLLTDFMGWMRRDDQLRRCLRSFSFMPGSLQCYSTLAGCFFLIGRIAIYGIHCQVSECALPR